MNKQLPQDLKKYFWDCDFNELSMDKFAFFISERILNFGNFDSVNWLLKQIDREFLIEVIKNSRNLNKKTRNYWKIKLCL